MITTGTLKFLKDLKKNNNKPWFDGHRDQYETARANVLELAAGLIKGLSVIEPGIGNLQPKDCLFRINRDVRFSKDKRPYKNNLSAYFNKGGKKSNGAGYYLHIEPGASFAAGGIWVPAPADLAKIRQEIDYSLDEWKALLSSREMKKLFPAGLESNETLTRPPKGYEESNPAISFLKLKNFVLTVPLSDEQMQNKSLVKDLVKIFSAIRPLNAFLGRAIEG